MSPEQDQQTKPEPEAHALRETVKDLAADSKAAIEHASEATKSALMKQPTTAAAIAGAVAMAAAVTLGVVETALGGAAAYAAYRLIRRRRGPGAH
jgi:hypothetical protein